MGLFMRMPTNKENKIPAPCKQDAGRVSLLGRLCSQARPGLAVGGLRCAATSLQATCVAVCAPNPPYVDLAPPPGILDDAAGLPDACLETMENPTPNETLDCCFDCWDGSCCGSHNGDCQFDCSKNRRAGCANPAAIVDDPMIFGRVSHTAIKLRWLTREIGS